MNTTFTPAPTESTLSQDRLTISNAEKSKSGFSAGKKTQLPETGFIRLPTILQLYPVSRASWWQGVREKRFPQGVKLGPRTTAWRVEDIQKLIEDAK